jgi:hypothetical protein
MRHLKINVPGKFSKRGRGQWRGDKSPALRGRSDRARQAAVNRGCRPPLAWRFAPGWKTCADSEAERSVRSLHRREMGVAAADDALAAIVSLEPAVGRLRRRRCKVAMRKGLIQKNQSTMSISLSCSGLCRGAQWCKGRVRFAARAPSVAFSFPGRGDVPGSVSGSVSRWLAHLFWHFGPQVHASTTKSMV